MSKAIDIISKIIFAIIIIALVWIVYSGAEVAFNNTFGIHNDNQLNFFVAFINAF